MLTINTPAINRQNVAEADEGTGLGQAAAPAEGVKVVISGAAMKLAKAQKDQNDDIEGSGLPDQVQKILKMIREIKKQIAEKQAQLQQVMANSNLNPEQAKAQAAGLQAAIAGLSAALLNANASLVKAMKDLSGEDALKASSLMAS
ncbi:hypothetical protein GV729_05785 [Pseudomonas sp. Fl4BN2]|nr:hypothetical protein [Pseudomonas sp. Fl4BN2]